MDLASEGSKIVGGGGAGSIEVVQPQPKPRRILLGVTKVDCLPAIQLIVFGLQNFGEVTVYAPENVFRMLDRITLSSKVLSDSDEAASMLQRGRFLYEEFRAWATHIIILSDSDLLVQMYLDRSEGTIPMLLYNSRQPKLVIPQIPYDMWVQQRNKDRVTKLRKGGWDVANCIFRGPTVHDEILERIVIFLDMN